MVRMIRRLRGDEGGVASTVGTIMALLVFLTFLSLIVNQYVPVWMTDSEASHMDAALSQFGNLKAAIDMQVLGAQITQGAGELYVPTTSSVGVTLGLDGFPIFAGPTTGNLASLPDQGGFSVVFAYSIKGVTTPVSQTSTGMVELRVQNNYLSPQQIAYDNGAVVRAQSDGQVIRAGPLFQVAKTGSNLTLGFELVNIYGSVSASGSSTELVRAQVFSVSQQTYTNIVGQGIWINQTSAYGRAWYDFVNTTLAQQLDVPGTFASSGYPILYPVSFTTAYYKVSVNLNPATGLYTFSLFVKNGPLIPTLILQQAYVNIGIGDQSNLGP